MEAASEVSAALKTSSTCSEALSAVSEEAADQAPAGTVQKGSDLQKSLTIDFEEAAFGTKKQIRINKFVKCKTCDGSGAAPGTSKKQCTKCGGSGEVRTAQRTPLGTFQSVSPCPDCNGTGEINETPCRDCGGSGRVKENVTIAINIPAGVDNDSVIPIKGQGSRVSTADLTATFTSLST
ncbi:MAG: zinc finger domain-containing protein [Clostridia bacterium]